ncbi:MAG TPA: hypothetical protein VE077_00080 [Candidatus Methylomirabilis sp.]|nr:hypothetical protein [Candidatus Methylomirabilis sp.]
MACGPDFSPPILIESRRPDTPPGVYATGNLGVVLPTYGPSYLVIAYRYFSGKPLDATEQSQFVKLWSHYHSGDGDATSQANSASSDWDVAVQSWQRDTQINFSDAPQVSSSPEPPTAFNPGSYDSYDNCLADAYETAVRTLAARSRQFGEKSAAVQGWLQAQLAVFQNCGSPTGETPAVLPETAPASLPEQIRNDRDYQIAAAYFYAGKWEEAENRFQAIATDSSSSWRAIAALVTARCDIRKGTLGTDDPDQRNHDFAVADARLRRIIADPTLASVRAGAESLRGYVEFRIQPQQRAVELSDLLERGGSPSTFMQNLDDYSQLMQEQAGAFYRDQALREKSDMTDWLFSFAGSISQDAEAHRITRWQETHSLAWLSAALLYAKPDAPQLTALLQAAAAVQPDAPAYLTLTFEKDRLLAEMNQQDAARMDIDKLLAMPKGLILPSSRNLLLALRLKLARNLDEFLRFSTRLAVASGPDDDDLLGPQSAAAVGQPMFDADASVSFTETMPVSVMIDAARSNALPAALRQKVAIAVWTRAIILRDDAAAQQVTPTLLELAPELKNSFLPYNSAKSSDARQLAALLILLDTPGLRPFVGTNYSRTPWSWGQPSTLTGMDEYRDNWWCTMTPQKGPNAAYMPSSAYPQFSPGFTSSLQLVYPDGRIPDPQFLTPAQRRAAGEEWATLVALPSAPDWFGEQSLAWAKADPEDPRVPQALHLAVRATRYGCTDEKTGDFSKRAFTLLHDRYPNSEWTKRTPHWFN